MRSTKLLPVRKVVGSITLYVIFIAIFSFVMGMALEAKIISGKLAQTPGFEILK